jgi:hypothetical protein
MPPRAQAVDAAALVTRLQQHNHDPDVQAQCCVSLYKSGQLSDEAALAFLPIILAALRAHPGSAALQLHGCVVLGFICRDRSEDALATSAAADAVRAVVDAMRAHPAEAGLQCMCCGALNSMTSLAVLRDAAVDAGAVQPVVAALHAHVRYGAGVGLVCDVLSRITEEHSVARAQAAAAGAVAAAVAVLHAHPASAALQAFGCSALGSLVFGAECRTNTIRAGAIEANKTNAIQAGAIEAILLALRAHPADANVQGYGCMALGNILADNTDAINARSGSLLSDAMHAAVAALNAHRTDMAVQQHACATLWHALVTDTLRIEAARIGAVAALVAALRAHPANAHVQETALGATGSLCFENSAIAVQACSAGALQAIVAGLRAHPTASGVQISGCDVLDSIIGAHPRLQAAAGAAGAVEAILDMMRAPPVDAELLRSSCMVLIRVVEGHRGNAERACAAGAVDLLAAAMGASCAHEHADSQQTLCDWSVRALDVLLEDNGAAAQRAVHADVLDIMAREGTERSHPSVLEAHTRLFSLLQVVAQRHDASVCTHAGCKRCAAARDAGGMCALAGCGARKRDGSKKLNRCGGCRVASYCGAAHQREDWARHKAECATLGTANEEGEQQPAQS